MNSPGSQRSTNPQTDKLLEMLEQYTKVEITSTRALRSTTNICHASPHQDITSDTASTEQEVSVQEQKSFHSEPQNIERLGTFIESTEVDMTSTKVMNSYITKPKNDVDEQDLGNEAASCRKMSNSESITKYSQTAVSNPSATPEILEIPPHPEITKYRKNLEEAYVKEQRSTNSDLQNTKPHLRLQLSSQVDMTLTNAVRYDSAIPQNHFDESDSGNEQASCTEMTNSDSVTDCSETAVSIPSATPETNVILPHPDITPDTPQLEGASVKESCTSSDLRNINPHLRLQLSSQVDMTLANAVRSDNSLPQNGANENDSVNQQAPQPYITSDTGLEDVLVHEKNCINSDPQNMEHPETWLQCTEADVSSRNTIPENDVDEEGLVNVQVSCEKNDQEQANPHEFQGNNVAQVKSEIARVSEIKRKWDRAKNMKQGVQKWMKEIEDCLSSVQSKLEALDTETISEVQLILEHVYSAICDTRSNIKKIKTVERTFQAKMDSEALAKALNELEGRANYLAEACVNVKNRIEKFNEKLKNYGEWLEETNEKFKTAKDISGSQEKIPFFQKILKLLDELGENMENSITELDNLSATDFDGPLEETHSKMLNEIESLQTRQQRLKQKCSNEIQKIEFSQKKIKKVDADLKGINEWLKEKLAKMKELLQPGYLKRNIQSALANIEILRKALMDKEVTLVSIRQEMLSLFPDKQDINFLENKLSDVQKNMNELRESLWNASDKLQSFLPMSEAFEKDLDTIKNYLTEGEQLLQRPIYVTGEMEYLQKLKHLYENEETFINMMEDTKIKQLQMLGKDIEEICSDADRMAMNVSFEEVSRRFQKIRKVLESKFKSLKSYVEQQEQYDELSKVIQATFDNTEATLNSELQLNAASEEREDYLYLYDYLLDCAQDISRLYEVAECIMKNMKDEYKSALQNQLEEFQDRQDRLFRSIEDRLDVLEETLRKQEELRKKTEQYSSNLKQHKSKMRDLAKPFSIRSGNVLGLIKNYDNILGQLREMEDDLEHEKFDENCDESLTEFVAEFCAFFEDLQEKQVRAEQAVAVRKQYETILGEIITRVFRYQENGTNNEESIASMDTKIKQYENLIDEINPKLNLVQDKGWLIVCEASASDRNTILEELFELSEELHKIRNHVQKLRLEREKIAFEQRKLYNDIINNFNHLRSHESIFRMKPRFTLSGNAVQKELDKLKDKAGIIGEQIMATRELFRKAENLPADSCFAPSREQNKEFLHVESSLLLAIKNREEYLNQVYDRFEKFQHLKRKLDKWLEYADTIMDEFIPGVDFEHISDISRRIKRFLKDAVSSEEMLSEIRALYPQIRDSLEESEISVLDDELDFSKKKMRCIIDEVTNFSYDLETDKLLWDEICNLLVKVKEIPNSSEVAFSKTNYLSTLKIEIDRLNYELSKLKKRQNLIGELNNKADIIKTRATRSCQDKLSKQIYIVFSVCQQASYLYQTHIDYLTNVWNNWQLSEELYSAMKKKLKITESKLNSLLLDNPSNGKYFQVLLEEAGGLDELFRDLDSLSDRVREFFSSQVQLGDSKFCALSQRLEELWNNYRKQEHYLNKLATVFK